MRASEPAAAAAAAAAAARATGAQRGANRPGQFAADFSPGRCRGDGSSRRRVRSGRERSRGAEPRPRLPGGRTRRAPTTSRLGAGRVEAVSVARAPPLVRHEERLDAWRRRCGRGTGARRGERCRLALDAAFALRDATDEDAPDPAETNFSDDEVKGDTASASASSSASASFAGHGGASGSLREGAGSVRDAFARSGCVSACAEALAELNAAAIEEAGLGPSGKRREGGGSEGGGNPKPSGGGDSKPSGGGDSKPSRHTHPPSWHNLPTRRRDETTPSGSVSKPPPGTSSTVSASYRDRTIALLRLVTRGGSAGASRCRLSLVADAKAAHALLAAAGPSLPRRALVPLLRLVLTCQGTRGRPALRSAAATPKLVRFLQWDDFATRDVAMRCLRNVCEDDAKSLEQAAVAGAVPHLVAVAAPECVAATPREPGGERDGRGNAPREGANGAAGHWARDNAFSFSPGGHGEGPKPVSGGFSGDSAFKPSPPATVASLRPIAAEMLCAMVAASRKTRLKLAEHDAMGAYLALARGGGGWEGSGDVRGAGAGARARAGSRLATAAIARWMAEEPWLAEARFSEPDALRPRSPRSSPRAERTPPGHDAPLDAMREGVLAPSPRLCAALADDPSGACVAALAGAVRRRARTRKRDTATSTTGKERKRKSRRATRVGGGGGAARAKGGGGGRRGVGGCRVFDGVGVCQDPGGGVRASSPASGGGGAVRPRGEAQGVRGGAARRGRGEGRGGERGGGEARGEAGGVGRYNTLSASLLSRGEREAAIIRAIAAGGLGTRRSTPWTATGAVSLLARAGF